MRKITTALIGAAMLAGPVMAHADETRDYIRDKLSAYTCDDLSHAALDGYRTAAEQRLAHLVVDYVNTVDRDLDYAGIGRMVADLCMITPSSPILPPLDLAIHSQE